MTRLCIKCWLKLILPSQRGIAERNKFRLEVWIQTMFVTKKKLTVEDNWILYHTKVSFLFTGPPRKVNKRVMRNAKKKLTLAGCTIQEDRNWFHDNGLNICCWQTNKYTNMFRNYKYACDIINSSAWRITGYIFCNKRVLSHETTLFNTPISHIHKLKPSRFINVFCDISRAWIDNIEWAFMSICWLCLFNKDRKYKIINIIKQGKIKYKPTWYYGCQVMKKHVLHYYRIICFKLIQSTYIKQYLHMVHLKERLVCKLSNSIHKIIRCKDTQYDAF